MQVNGQGQPIVAPCSGFLYAKRYDQLATSVAEVPQGPSLQVLPNPVRDAFTVEGVPAGAVVTLCDAAGRSVRTWGSTLAGVPYGTAGLAPGLYLLRVQGQERAVRLVIERP